MAVDVCSEIFSPGISPRISFSHDLKDTDGEHGPNRPDAHLLESSSDFDFCISAAAFISSAEELFSDGKILPGEIKKTKSVPLEPADPPLTRRPEKKRLKEFLLASSDTEEPDDDPPPPPRSFWQFNRSSSLNCDATRNKGLIRSLHFLSRSNSTGSAPNPKQQSQNLKRQPSVSSRRSTSSSSSSSGSSFGMPYSYSSWQKQQQQHPPHKKHYHNGVRVSPVLNFQPHISIGTGSLFGLGSLFCNGKIRRKKK